MWRGSGSEPCLSCSATSPCFGTSLTLCTGNAADAAHGGHTAFLLASSRHIARMLDRPISAEPPAWAACPSSPNNWQMSLWETIQLGSGKTSLFTTAAQHRPSALVFGGSRMLEVVAGDAATTSAARGCGRDALAHYLAGAYQRLALACIFHSDETNDRKLTAAPPLRVAGGVADIIIRTIRLPRVGCSVTVPVPGRDRASAGAGGASSLRLAAGWVECLVPTLGLLVSEDYWHAPTAVGARFIEQGWVWRREGQPSTATVSKELAEAATSTQGKDRSRSPIGGGRRVLGADGRGTTRRKKRKKIVVEELPLAP